MADVPEFVAGSVEYLHVLFTADHPLPDGEPVEIFLGGTWYDAEWQDTEANIRSARTLIDFSGVAVGTHQIYGRLTDNPEIPVIDAGKVRVKAQKTT